MLPSHVIPTLALIARYGVGALSSGFETSASALGSIVLSLLQHPAELARLEDELDAFGLLKTPKRPEPRCVLHFICTGSTCIQHNTLMTMHAPLSHSTALSQPPRAIEWDDVGRMTFLNAVIKETLRLQSPASLGTLRVASKMTKVRAA
jgi:cytochrome P450